MFNTLKLALTDFSQNKILIIPLLIQVFVTLVVSVAFFFLGAYMLSLMFGFNFSVDTINVLAQQPESIFVGVFIFLVAAFVLLLITAWFEGGYYAMVFEATKKGTALKTFWKGAKIHFVPLFVFSLLKMVLFAALILPVAVLGFFTQTTLGLVLFLLFVLILLVGSIFLSLGFLFTPPLIVRKKLSGYDGMSFSLNYLFKKPWYVIKTGLFMLGVVLIVSVIFSILSFFIPESNIFLMQLFSFLQSVVQLIMAVVLSLFLFRVSHAIK